MSDDFLSNLTSLTDNLNDIAFTRYATITQINTDNTVDCREDSGTIHKNVKTSQLNDYKLGDIVVLGFVDNNIYNPIILSADSDLNTYTKSEINDNYYNKSEINTSIFDKIRNINTNGGEALPNSRITQTIWEDPINGDKFLNGILENAYHDLTGCDTNAVYSWFAGFLTPVGENVKDTFNTVFVIMYNDTPYNDSDEHELDNNEWHTVFTVDTNGIVW